MNQSLPRQFVAEAIGTAMLLAAVVGSGIMGERLAAGNVALALLANSIATGGDGSVRHSRVHYGGLLVHGFDLICKSCRDIGALGHGHFCGD